MQTAADGARQSWDAARAAVERTQEIAKGLAEDITGPIREALKSGELSWQTFAGAVSGIAQNLASRLIDLAFKPIEDALFRALSGAGSAAAVAPRLAHQRPWRSLRHGRHLRARAVPSGRPARSRPLPRRRGSGSVVSRPTVFPFARGIGLMGEAGPEAILPLRRGRGGRLGRRDERRGPAPQAEMSTRIINVLDPSVVGDYLATPAGERAIVNVIRRNRGAINA